MTCILDHMIYDVTPRYASQWCTNTCKNRIDSKWWSECLQPFTPPIEECELENEDMTGLLLSSLLNDLLLLFFSISSI